MKTIFLALLVGAIAPAARVAAIESALYLPTAHVGTAQRARAAFEQGDYAEAERLYEAIVADAPANAFALSNLGVTRFRAGKLRAAEEALRRAVATAPDDDFSHCLLGIVFYSQARDDAAVNALTKALAINPKNATAHRYLSVVAERKGWREAARRELELAEKLEPSPESAPLQGDFLTPLEKSRLQPPQTRQ